MTASVDTSPTVPVLAAAAEGWPRLVDAVRQAVRIPSVSGEPGHRSDVRACARWLADRLRRAGLPTVRVVPTAGHPVVIGEWRGRRHGPVVLVYGHYDVQPPGPAGAWNSPPFAGDVRGDHLYGRGASDDKGQLLTHIAALEAYLRSRGDLPVNVVVLAEGEEEIGSPHLAEALERWGGDLAEVDAVLVSDTSMPAPDQPALTDGLRGVLGVDLVVTGPGRPLHSGLFGGTVHNPAQALCTLLASLHEEDGRVALPGFYAAVRDVARTGRRRRHTTRAGLGPAQGDRGISTAWGEPGYAPADRVSVRPALNLNRIGAGYPGTAAASIIPEDARAQLDIRLVPDQTPEQVEAQLREYLARAVPATVRVRCRARLRSNPVVVDRHAPVLVAAADALTRVFGRAPVWLRSGGTIPAVPLLQAATRAPVVLMGFGLPQNRIHAPNERLHLPTLQRALATSVIFLTEAARALDDRAR